MSRQWQSFIEIDFHRRKALFLIILYFGEESTGELTPAVVY